MVLDTSYKMLHNLVEQAVASGKQKHLSFLARLAVAADKLDVELDYDAPEKIKGAYRIELYLNNLSHRLAIRVYDVRD